MSEREDRRDPWRTPKWAARELGCHVSAIHRRIRSGHLKAVRLPGGRAWRFRESWFWSMMEGAPDRPARAEPAGPSAARETLRRAGIG